MQSAIKILIVIVIVHMPFWSKSQAFNINTFFTEPQYAFYSSDSNNYLFDQVKTQLDLENRLDSVFKLPTGSFYNATNKISFSGDRTFLSGLHNQVPNYDTMFKECKINYTYSGIQSSTYSFFVSSSADTSFAFLIMPGSGSAQSLKIVEGNSSNYHNTICKIKDLLRAKGDVYVYNRPNEEFRGIWTNFNNTNNYRRLSYDVLDPYTKLNGRDWQDNLFSEFTVWLHFLKNKYKRVVVLGISAGGWPALFSSQQIQPDACILAAGFSAASYQNFSVPNNSNTILDGVLGIYTLDSLRKNIRASNTEYLFTYGNGDTGGNLYEYNTHALQDSLNKPTVAPNIHFSYFIGGHTFHCLSLDTFLNRVLNKPKPIVKVLDSGCNTDSVLCQVELLGTPPFTFDLYRDSIYITSYSSNTNNFQFSVTQNGTYQIRHLDDAGTGIGYKSDWFKIELNPKPSLVPISKVFVCDSNLAKVKIKLNGTSPFQLTDSLNGTFSSRIINDSIYTYSIPNQQTLKILQLNDAAGCSESVFKSFPVNETAVNAVFQTPSFVCDSLKSALNINLSGKAPWLIHYIKDGLFYSYNATSNNTNMLLSNGVYNFFSVVDSNTCSKSLSTIFNLNFKELTVNFSSSQYICDSNKSLMVLTLNGNPPYNVFYRKNGTPASFSTSSNTHNLWLTNGNYTFDSIKDATCKKIINSNFLINYSPLNISIGASSVNCDSNKTSIPITISGNPPYLFKYQKNGTPQNTILNGNTNLLLTNGTYLFQEVEDALGCKKVINQVNILNHQALNFSASSPTYNCDSNKSLMALTLNGNPPYNVFYRKNGMPASFSTSSNTYNLWLTNGNYIFDSIKDATCKKNIPTNNYLINTSPVNVVISNPSYVCDSNKTKLSFSCQGTPPYNLYYKINSTPTIFNTGLSNFDLYFSNSNLLIEKIVDANGCEKIINNNYNFNESPVSAVLTSPVYNCDSALHFMNVLTTGKSPWTISYSNGVNTNTFTTSLNFSTLKLPNGNYTILSVQDGNACVKPINQSFILNANPTSVSVLNAGYDCDSNKLKLIVNLTHHGPWILQFQKVAPNNQTFSWIANAPSNTFYFSPGTYILTSVKNQLGCTTAVGYSFTNNFSPLSISKLTSFIDCDSAKLKTTYQLNGDGPWNLLYQNLNSGLYSFLNSGSPFINLYTPSGHFKLAQLSDSKCTIQLSDTLSNNYVPLTSQILDQSPACDSGKTKINLLSAGGILPYTYSYAFNGTNLSQVSNKDSLNLFLPKGSLYLLKVSDSLGCSYNLNSQLTLDYSPFRFDSLTSYYHCNTDSSFLKYHCDNSSPLTVNYSTKNGNTEQFTFLNNKEQYLPNNTYYIHSITDTFGCSLRIDDTINVYNYPLKEQKVTKVINCTFEEYKFFYQLSGTPPWRVNYILDNSAQQMLISESPVVLPAYTGNYYFISVIDSNQCQDTIHQYHQLLPFIDTAFSITYSKAMLSVYIPAVKYIWYKDEQAFDTTQTPRTAFIGNGTYTVKLVDSLGCEYTSLPLKIENIDPIIVYPNPSEGLYTITLNYALTEPWSYTLFDMYGRKIKSETFIQNYHQLDIRHLANGKYLLYFHYNENGFYTYKVIAIEKR